MRGAERQWCTVCVALWMPGDFVGVCVVLGRRTRMPWPCTNRPGRTCDLLASHPPSPTTLRWTIAALADKFRIRRQRVMAILAFKEIQAHK